MFISRNLTRILFGKLDSKIVDPFKNRRSGFNFPSIENEKGYNIEYPSHDGLILAILKKIDKENSLLKSRILELEKKLENKKVK